MRPRQRLILLGVAVLTLDACGFSSVGTDSGSVAPATPDSSATPTGPVTPPKAAGSGGNVSGTDDAVASIASIGGTLLVAVGASQSVVVTFTSNDGLPISGFAVSGSLGSLPAGWSGPSNLSCATVAPGNGCALSLTYAPTAIDSGTLTLDCVYIDNAGLPRTPGPCLTLAYAAAARNNVVATASPAGEIDAIVGSARQSVSVNFTSDDGTGITDFTLTTSPVALPAGWSSSVAGLSCAVVSTGSGCQLPLDFAPTTAAAGVLALNYAYTDNSGASRTGTLNIPFASTAHGTVVATASPTGQINAVDTTGSQSVSITFDTSDGSSAADLSVSSDLTMLPPGWSSMSKSFSCAVVSTGNGCQLQLQFSPVSLGGGTLSISYDYLDSSGAPNSGLLNVAYAATTNDTVAGAPSPTGQVNALLGSAGQPVSVTFTTNDGRLATGLKVTGLASLPTGWSSAASGFTCSELSTGDACQLPLMFTPTAVDAGTLTLNYAYTNNAGEAKSGSLGIPYRTTSNDSIIGTPDPSSLAVATGSSNTVIVTFATNDGNLAGDLSANLADLPEGWSAAAGSFTCASVSVGTGCQLSLTYAPTAAASATLSFGYSYTNAAGTMKAGTVSIPYSAGP